MAAAHGRGAPRAASGFLRKDQYLSVRIRFELTVSVGDAIEREAAGDAAGESPLGGERQRFRDEGPNLLLADKPGSGSVLRHEDRAGVHQVKKIDRGQLVR